MKLRGVVAVPHDYVEVSPSATFRHGAECHAASQGQHRTRLSADARSIVLDAPKRPFRLDAASGHRGALERFKNLMVPILGIISDALGKCRQREAAGGALPFRV